MKNRLLILLIGFFISSALLSQESKNLTADYINGVFFYKRLDYMRHSYDRWRMIMDENFEGKNSKTIHSGFYSAMYDFNYGWDASKIKSRPMLFGFALGDNKDKFGYYFLLYSTDFNLNTAAWFNKEEKKKYEDQNPFRFNSYSFGLSYQFKYFSLLSDFTLAGGTPSIYGKIFFPFLKSHIGMGTSKFDEILDPVDEQKKIIRSKVFNIDYFNFATSAIPYFNLGLRVLRFTRSKFAPNISFATYQFVNNSRWAKMGWDAEFFFETKTENVKKISELKDYDTRITIYKLIGDPVDKTKGFTTTRGTIFFSVSYKSKEDFFNQTLSESGMVYTGQSGFGYEAGVGFRVIGFKKYGFEEDTFLRLSYHYNYSSYFERFPAIQHGIKFKVIM